MNWEVGQEVWIVPHDKRSKPRASTIARIARRWVYFGRPDRSGGRFDKETGELDGGQYSSPATAWASHAEYEDWVSRNEAWQRFHQSLPRIVPRHVTDGTIAEIEALIAGSNDKGGEA
ncbi:MULTISPECIES: hypothetical protein [Marivita]|uniref:Uncharacterized protein n=1 Tax=Marivita cryptomonadis TaxID=505252 RepID=A0A9Q2PD55_9RHOB|nr:MULTISPECIES: hypothetical protein [Marivita]MCR9167933.1 hypothetical protein [Paracoccaceae bacterium]MBM2322694.1 hypothetical protein [Marivita cryptomonadis]MBM2332276.1 hypothetical protein [Marivita cryptomonadis]MBM2341860.1 hypothetical protein [Marivita cryptomonadis]MBM2346524.1 hypothetical protein [Marivita cryptomonadis]